MARSLVNLAELIDILNTIFANSTFFSDDIIYKITIAITDGAVWDQLEVVV